MTRELIDDDDDESMMSVNAFCHVYPCAIRHAQSRMWALLVAVQIGRLTVVAQTCGSMHSTGETRDERGMISSDGTASGGPVQQEKLRRTHESMQAKP